MKSSRIRKAWTMIEAWLAEHAPAVRADLAPGAKERDLRAFEELLGCALPADFRESLTIHNGQKDKLRLITLLENEFLLPVAGKGSITQSWKTLKKLADTGAFAEYAGSARGKLKDDQWWNRKWVPFTDSDGDGFCLDLDPGKGGRKGQVFYFYHDGAGARKVLAQSFSEWLEALARKLTRGDFQLDDDDALWLAGDRLFLRG